MFLRFKGLEFGGDSGDLIITNFSAPTLEIKNNYKDRANEDGMMVSKDYFTKAVWGFSLATNGANLQDALDMAGELQSRWQDKGGRMSAFPTILEYSHNGEDWRRVYGRPGKFTSLEPNVHATLGVGRIDMEFIQTVPYTFSSEDRAVTINAVPAVQGGITSPVTAPITTVSSGGERAGRVENYGNVTAPLIVRFYGPSTNPTIRNNYGYELTYNGTLAYDQVVEINPVYHSVDLRTGGQTYGTQVPGRLSRRTRIRDLVTPPGSSDWYYEAVDDSGTSRAELITRDAYNTFK